MPIKSYIFPASLTRSLLLGLGKSYPSPASSLKDLSHQKATEQCFPYFCCCSDIQFSLRERCINSQCGTVQPCQAGMGWSVDGVQARVTATQNQSNVPRTGIWKQWKSKERNMQTVLQPSVDKALQATATLLIPGISPWILCRGRGFNPSTGERWGSRGQTIHGTCLK